MSPATQNTERTDGENPAPLATQVKQVPTGPFTVADLAACAERELVQRLRAYPRWVEAKRMTRAMADRQTALMQAIACKLRAEADAEGVKGDLFGAEVRRG